ncbi:hypothetical protein HNY73_011333 [Argiope bruennichi]|uniref:Uncharacterized protein n=1 Tax=Argiope bruennichi TaxID=94029 RepID=A0A8T0F8W6_ARGBR|nr:hypothetical protein HNY73_011333 [Argiope bruennichi]
MHEFEFLRVARIKEWSSKISSQHLLDIAWSMKQYPRENSITCRTRSPFFEFKRRIAGINRIRSGAEVAEKETYGRSNARAFPKE